MDQLLDEFTDAQVAEQLNQRGWRTSGGKPGSGSLEKDSPVLIVAMKKEEQTRFVHHHRLGKRQRHAHKTSQALTERIVPALHVGGFARLFAHGCVLLRHRMTAWYAAQKSVKQCPSR